AELNRPPFDLVEAEQELVGGFHTEYSSIRFGMFYLAEFMNTITMSAIIVTLFLGGPAGPVLFGPAAVWGILWFTLKVLLFLFTFVWLRATLPRYRYDQLMDLGWKRLIPLALGWLLVIGAQRVGLDRGWDRFVTGAASLAVLTVAAMALFGAIRVAQHRRHGDEFGELVG
ncbi:MAG: NADH-quinone oxidoreductase subunit H, partial [Actinobacteria bacterium]|nr:NADH-quinone oxidoreductase subunit H [Actinomycetota bacterium]